VNMTSENNFSAELVVGSANTSISEHADILAVAPGQVVSTQASAGNVYHVAQNGAFIDDLVLEEDGKDLVVGLPNGGRVVLRDFVFLRDAGQCTFLQEEPYLEDKENLAEEATEEDAEEVNLASNEEATDGENFVVNEIANEAMDEIDGTTATNVGNRQIKAEEEVSAEPGLWTGLGILAAAGIAIVSQDDDGNLNPGDLPLLTAAEIALLARQAMRLALTL
jgi:hypothetical protein